MLRCRRWLWGLQMSETERNSATRHVIGVIREHLTHWVIAGVIIALTGFAPEHWFADALHSLPEGLRRWWPAGS